MFMVLKKIKIYGIEVMSYVIDNTYRDMWICSGIWTLYIFKQMAEIMQKLKPQYTVTIILYYLIVLISVSLSEMKK